MTSNILQKDQRELKRSFIVILIEQENWEYPVDKWSNKWLFMGLMA